MFLDINSCIYNATLKQRKYSQKNRLFPKYFSFKDGRNGKIWLVLMIKASPERLVGIEEDDFGE